MTKNKELNFKPAFGLANKHLQTIYSSLFRKTDFINYEIETFWFSDGDFTECYWNKVPNHNTNTPIVILFHGLAGSYKSQYIQGIMNKLYQNNFTSVLMHFRGCSGKDNLFAKSYHSGDSNDAMEYITNVTNKYPKSKLFAVGYSLGGNMLLKLLGEKNKDTFLHGAISISAPIQLDICANQMNKGFSKFYQKILLKELTTSLMRKFIKHDMKTLINLKRDDIKKLKTFWDFDGAYTAPIHGFNSAQDYYTKCSSKQYLNNIQVSTLIIHSLDDPFMTTDVLPNKDEVSKNVRLLISEKGGHVGFVSGTLFEPIYWSENIVVKFFTELL